ncbi:hypothetical protein [Gallaecimonas mangrovi]|nr:hypothetical protein [Gallaecimonas mangrovi]
MSNVLLGGLYGRPGLLCPQTQYRHYFGALSPWQTPQHHPPATR